MNILALETSSGYCSIALVRDNKIQFYVQDEEPNMQAEHLFDLIDYCFEKNGISYKDVGCLAVSRGPGSFTGIRIGLSSARGILFAAPHIKPIGISYFEVLAYRISKQINCHRVDQIAVCYFVSSQEVYMQTFDGALNSTSEPLSYSKQEFIDILNAKKGATAISGYGLDQVVPELKSLANLLILPRFTSLTARSMAMAARYKLDASNLSALYLKPASTNIK